MLRSFRFLFQFAWINLSCLLGFAVLVVAGCYITGVPGGADNLFATYYGAFPLVILFVLFIFAFSLCTSNLNLGLSLGARRREFFWGIQGVFAVYTGVCWAVQLLLAALPQQCGWSEAGRWTVIRAFSGGTLWVFPLVCLTMLVLGCLGGMVSVKSKAWGAVIISAAVIALFVGAILLAVMADLDAWAFLTGSAWSGLWGSLPALLTIGMFAALVIGEAVIWRQIFRFAVR